MKKIPTMFVRDEQNLGIVLDVPHPDCAWVFRGQGRATRKYDGTACLIEQGVFYKRRVVKAKKSIPQDFIEVDADPVTAKCFGWVPVSDDDRWHMEAFAGCEFGKLAISVDDWQHRENGTYELIGPKIQGNPEGFQNHCLISHTRDVDVYEDVPRTFDGLREWLSSRDIEGLVFQHLDGRMAKIKKRDFGLPRAADKK